MKTEREFIEKLLEMINENIQSTEVHRHNEYTYEFSKGEIRGKKEIEDIVKMYAQLVK